MKNGELTSGMEYLAFTMGQSEYGVDILQVQEIREYEEPTRLVNVPDYVRGVFNLRGTIVPVVDLRMKCGMTAPKYDRSTIVIILSIHSQTVGIVVDGVSDVHALSPGQIQPAPALGNAIDAQYLTGLGTVEDRLLILVDIEKLLSSADLGLIGKGESPTADA